MQPLVEHGLERIINQSVTSHPVFSGKGFADDDDCEMRLPPFTCTSMASVAGGVIDHLKAERLQRLFKQLANLLGDVGHAPA